MQCPLFFQPLPLRSPISVKLEKYYHTKNEDENPFICSEPGGNGMRDCGSVPKVYEEGGLQCTLSSEFYNSTDNTTCVNWNQYYNNCTAGLVNPFKGAINFDNICYAWIAIFQVKRFARKTSPPKGPALQRPSKGWKMETKRCD